MIKLCENSIYKPLSITFNDCLKEGKFPFGWKKAVVPVHQKRDCLINYRPISVLPICRMNVWFMSFSPFLLNLISPNQSGFRPGDSCVNQIIAVTQYVSCLMMDLK